MRGAADQYRIIAAGAGWIHRRDRGRLRFEGRDAARFLHGLLTNDIQSLGPGQGVYAAHLTPQGRMVADLTIHQCGDYLLAEIPLALAGDLTQRFDQLVFTEDVRVANVSESIAQVCVFGEGAAGLLADALAPRGVERAQLARLPSLGHLIALDLLVARSDALNIPAFDLFAPTDARDATVRRLEEAGAVAASDELVDALRIEAGRPAYGIDMNQETIPLEAGLLERGISTTKGCYVGQEVIIRVLHRGGGRVAKRLVRLRFDPDLHTPPSAGSTLTRDGRIVGRLTSAAVSPTTGNVLGLGYVHRDHAETGVRLSLSPEAGGGSAEIVGLAG